MKINHNHRRIRMKRYKAFCKTVLAAFLMLWYILGYSMYVGNYSNISFTEPVGTTDSTTAATASIKELIIKSATYFLKGKANVDLLASKLEAADTENLCFYELQGIVNDAMADFKAVRSYYLALKNRAGVVPYNKEVIGKLISFDYDSFMKENCMNNDIYNQVRGYLGEGNVRGIYDRFYTYIGNIIQLLETVQYQVSNFETPVNISWKLNQECAYMLLFGQYISQTFYHLIGGL